VILMAKLQSQPSLVRTPQFLLPNLITAARIVCGFVAVVFAFRGMYWLDASGNLALSATAFDNAAKAIGWAILLDSLDGKVARLVGAGSTFGREFDSLADVVTFGMAAPVLLFFWGVMPIHAAVRTHSSEVFYVAGWIVACTFLVCGAFRLARFNLGDEQPDGEDRNSDGLPIPGAAGVIAAVVHFAKSPLNRFDYGVAWLGLAAVLSLLMTSRIRYDLRAILPLSLQKPVFSILFGCLLVWGVLTYSEQVLLVLALGFVTGGFLAHFIRRLRPHTLVARS
jgi:CDP-diacylglycerol--serine O-phosphatidyltransferase